MHGVDAEKENEKEKEEAEDDVKTALPELSIDEPLDLLGLLPGQHFTKPPPRSRPSSPTTRPIRPLRPSPRFGPTGMISWPRARRWVMRLVPLMWPALKALAQAWGPLVAPARPATPTIAFRSKRCVGKGPLGPYVRGAFCLTKWAMSRETQPQLMRKISPVSSISMFNRVGL